MKSAFGFFTCIALAAICSAALLRGDDVASDASKQGKPYNHKFSKHEFDSAGRTNFTLDLTLTRPDLIVSAWCDLRDEQQQGIGRFLLGDVNDHAADAPLKFRINCLAKAYIEKSTIRVDIRERKSNQTVGVLELSLRDVLPDETGSSPEKR